MARYYYPPVRQVNAVPQIDEVLLLSHLVRTGEAMMLKHIRSGHAYFESTLKYPVGPRTTAEYTAIATLSLTDPIFHTELSVTYVYPSRVQTFTTLTFKRLTDRSGMGVKTIS